METNRLGTARKSPRAFKSVSGESIEYIPKASSVSLGEGIDKLFHRTSSSLRLIKRNPHFSILANWLFRSTHHGTIMGHHPPKTPVLAGQKSGFDAYLQSTFKQRGTNETKAVEQP